jgi:FUN14 family.
MMTFLTLIVIPFLIGVLVGGAVKAASKFLLLLVLLIALLSVAGIVTISVESMLNETAGYLPRALNLGRTAVEDILPYSGLSFLAGFLLGVWKL